jgi:hypothetical protein
MQTRNSSPPQTPAEAPPLEASGKAQWSEADEIALIEYIAEHKAEAGDGMKFKSSFWSGAAKAMVTHSVLGGVKTSQGCSSKWDRVRTKLSQVILLLTHINDLSSSRSHTMSSLRSKPIHPDSVGAIPRASTSQSMRPVHGMNILRYVWLACISPAFSTDSELF